MGFYAELLTVDMDALHTRVLPAVRGWVVDGVVADWWRVALQANRISALSRVDYPLAADLDAADEWIQIFDPWVGLRDVVADQFWDPAVGFRDVPGGHEDLRSAIEIAVTSAAVDRVGIGKAYVETDLLSYEHEPDQVLFPNPQPGERITTLVERLEWGLIHMQYGGGGYGEGLRGMLDPADTAALDDELTARGSTAVVGTTRQIKDAILELSNVMSAGPRSTLVAMHAMAHRARGTGLGLLLGRDLHTKHLGD